MVRCRLWIKAALTNSEISFRNQKMLEIFSDNLDIDAAAIGLSCDLF